jgi:ATP-dependent Clp protease adaptor protein ClpS
MSEDLSVAVEKKTKAKLAQPKDWKVILLNDDKTPMDFVVGVLKEIFHHTPETATKVMLEIHSTGSGVAGVYSYEIAESKSVETTEISRSNGFPLQVKLEEE